MLNETEIYERQQRAIAGTEQVHAPRRSSYGVPQYVRLSPSIVQVEDWNQRAAAKASPLSNRTLSDAINFSSQRFSNQQTHSTWLFDAILELEKLPKAAAEAGLAVPSADTLDYATKIIHICAEERLSEPVIDNRSNGEVEIFFKEENKGLFLVVNRTGVLQIFGDFAGEAWRARYDLSGAIWPVHLKGFCRDLIRQVPRPLHSATQRF